MIEADNFPEVPENQRPRSLYIDSNLNSEEIVKFRLKGWLPVDLRLLPDQTDAERADAVKCWLAGVRMGSIQPSMEKLKHLELEATVYGLKTGKPSTAGKKIEDVTNIEELLTFNSPRAFRGTMRVVQESKPKEEPVKKPGRPKKMPLREKLSNQD